MWQKVEVVRRAFESFNRRNLDGAVAALELYQAAWFRDDKVTRVQGFRTAADAIAAVGVRE